MSIENEIAKSSKLDFALSWIRLLLPVVLSALGWYIGQTVGDLNTRITYLESQERVSREEFIEFKATTVQSLADINRRLALNATNIVHNVTDEQFSSFKANVDKRLDRIEDRLDNN